MIRAGYPTFAPELDEGDGGDAAYLYDELYAAESTHFWFRARNRLLAWAMRRCFPSAGNFLEIGCGTAFVLSAFRESFPHLRLAASDILTRGLGFAARRVPEAFLFQMDARRIPFEQEFDVIGAFDVIEHIEDDEVVLAQMFKAVRPGGGILLTVPQHRFLWSHVDVFSGHKRRYSRGELLSKLRRAGFEPVLTTSFVSLLLPLLLLSRLRQRSQPADFDPTSELRVAPGLNRSLDRVQRVEQSLIAAGLRLPAGGSLLSVAHRPQR